ncbi:MAG: DUF177 domain-containing protein [Ilumatobacter sp.]|nr:DUF177 domain-containing protein [Ilumatobacter sp.]
MDEVMRALRVNAIELLRQPGATREVSVSADGATLGVVHDRLDGEISAALTLESMNDGIIVTGEVRAPWATSCRRCLKDITGVAVAEVDERYQVEPTDADAYALEGNEIHLAPLVREIALLELDDEQLCAPDCAGLCPLCGVDRNTTQCDCDTTVTDDRWAALDGLVLDD